MQAAARVSDTDDHYDVSVHGPNGFLRRFAGSLKGVGGLVEVSSSFGRGKFIIGMNNKSSSKVVLSLASNNSQYQPRTIALEPGAAATASWEFEHSNHASYDVVATLDVDPLFRRRFVGHVGQQWADT